MKGWKEGGHCGAQPWRNRNSVLDYVAIGHFGPTNHALGLVTSVERQRHSCQCVGAQPLVFGQATA